MILLVMQEPDCIVNLKINRLTVFGLDFVDCHCVRTHTLFIVLCLVMPVIALSQNDCENTDFEETAAAQITSSVQIDGWTLISSNPTPGYDYCKVLDCCIDNPGLSRLIHAPNGHIDTLIGTIYPIFSVFGQGQNSSALSYNPHLPTMGGSNFLRINSPASNGKWRVEQLSRTFSVSPTMNLLKIAYMIALEPAHLCCNGSGFRLSISTSSCLLENTYSCPSTSLTGYFDAKTGGAATSTSSIIYSKWRVHPVDLSPFMGQLVTVSVSASRCTIWGHAGYAFVDFECGSSFMSFNGTPVPNDSADVRMGTCKEAFTLSAIPFFDKYVWLGPNGFYSTATTVTAAAHGTYTLTMIKGTCDPVVKEITISYPPDLSFKSPDLICVGDSVTLKVSGAASYSWTNGSENTHTMSVMAMRDTSYYVNGRDSLGCKVTGSVSIKVNPLPVLEVKVPQRVCAGTEIKLAATGAIQYTWNAEGFTSTDAAPVYMAGQVPQTVQFTVAGKNQYGCVAAEQFSVEVLSLPVVTAAALTGDVICRGETLLLRATGADHYGWHGPPSYYAQGGEVKFLMGPESVSGTFTVTGVDAAGCKNSAYVHVNVPVPPAVVITGERSGCTPFCTTIEALYDTSIYDMQMEWEFNNGKYQGLRQQFCISKPGEYSLTVIRRDKVSGCTASQSTILHGYRKPIAGFITDPERITEFTEAVRFFAVEPGSHAEWFFPDERRVDPSPQKTFSEPGTYVVALVTANQWDCRDTIVDQIVVHEEPLIFIPDAFTPNSDERNDRFFPVAREGVSFTMRIYDRWGATIYDSNNSIEGWDGTANGVKCQEGVYTCEIILKKSQDASPETRILHVTLVR